MHESSYETMRAFVETHLAAQRGRNLDILDFGSQVVDMQAMSYRTLLDDPAWSYRGVDIAEGDNVDIVLTDPYAWDEIGPDSVDLVVSGQAFEHVELFWASMFEIARVIRPGGVAAIIAPSGGFEHRYPVDCWRFYRDGFDALARHVGMDVVDAFTDWGHGDWADSILVARKPHLDADARAAFLRRVHLQRELTGSRTGGAVDADVATEPTPSAFGVLQAGALSVRLGELRTVRLQAEEAHRADVERHRAAEVESRIDIEAESRVLARLEPEAQARVDKLLPGEVERILAERMPGEIERRVAEHLNAERSRRGVLPPRVTSKIGRLLRPNGRSVVNTLRRR